MHSKDPGSDPYRDYYREIELHWSWRRGNQIIVSPLEFEGIESWYEAEIPLPVVLRAIDLFVEKKEKAKRKRNYLLTHVDDTVNKVFREYQSLHIGDDGGDEDLLQGKLRSLLRKLRKAAKEEHADSAYLKELTTQLKTVNTDGIVQFEELDAQLRAMDEAMLQHHRNHLSEADRQAIEGDAADVVSADEDAEFFEKLVLDAVRMHFGLPRLTLLG